MTVAAQPEAGLDDLDNSPQTVRRESFAAAIHELSERLTATTNYVAAALRLAELAMAEKANCSALEKALAQLDRTGDIVRSLRKSMQKHRP